LRHAAPEGPRLAPFFAGLRGDILAAWQSPLGFAYDRVIYSVSYPYTEGDVTRVLAWCGRAGERARLPAVGELNRTLEAHSYPELASRAPPGVSAHAWSAVLHFCDPSYPIYTERAAEALSALGFDAAARGGEPDYGAFVAAVDELKVEAPAASIPETNWYLARNLGVGLEGWWQAGDAHGRPVARAAAAYGRN